MQTTSIDDHPPINNHEESQSSALTAIETIGNRCPFPAVTAFAWLNTLQGFERASVRGGHKAGQLFGCHPYLTEDRYHDKFMHKQIRRQDLVAMLEDRGADNVSINSLATRLELRLAMLEYPLHSALPADALVGRRDRRPHPAA